MSHTIVGKAKLIARIRRIRGQVEAVERALESELGCADVLQLVAAARGAMNGLTAELIEEHLHSHVLHAEGDRERELGALQLMDVIKTYLR